MKFADTYCKQCQKVTEHKLLNGKLVCIPCDNNEPKAGVMPNV